jgi:hypothetical protein
MPYPFAHPAAVLPLVGPLGRLAVPSALVIGCMIPDAWYLVGVASRETSHSLPGLLRFCLPAGLLAYLAFHLLLKQALAALLPAYLASRLVPYLAKGLPAVPWRAVLASLLCGAATHLAWDGLTHERAVVNGVQLLQHASTLLGTAILAGWLWRWFRRAPAHPVPPDLPLPLPARVAVLLALIAVPSYWALAQATAPSLPASVEELRDALRTAGMAAAQAFALSSIGYALVWKLLR